MNSMMRAAELMAAGRATVPKHLQGNASDCMAVIMQAMQWGMNPFVVAQKTHIVNGALGYEAQLVNAVLQSSGAIKGRFRYEYRGDGNELECRVGAGARGRRGHRLERMAEDRRRHDEGLPTVEDQSQAAVGLPAGEELGARLQARSHPGRLPPTSCRTARRAARHHPRALPRRIRGRQPTAAVRRAWPLAPARTGWTRLSAANSPAEKRLADLAKACERHR